MYAEALESLAPGHVGRSIPSALLAYDSVVWSWRPCGGSISASACHVPLSENDNKPPPPAGITKLSGARGSLALPPAPGSPPHSAGTHPSHTLTCPPTSPTPTPQLLTLPPPRDEGGAPSDVVDGGCDCFQSVGLVELQAIVVTVPALRLYICQQETVSAFTL